MDRRKFIAGIGYGITAYGLWPFVGCAKPAEPENSGPVCEPPRSARDLTLLALAETVVPGYATDPSGAPGAVETCVLELLADDRYPAVGILPLVTSIADTTSQKLFGADFVALTPEQRFEVSLKAVDELPQITLFYKFIRSAFYTDALSWIGLDYMGYRLPPEGAGWVDAPDFSLRKPVCVELTDTGYLP